MSCDIFLEKDLQLIAELQIFKNLIQPSDFGRVILQCTFMYYFNFQLLQL